MPISKIQQTASDLKEFLTLYHEYQIPRNYFFDFQQNQVEDRNLLVISSPSRMGNHLLMSMLDSHPQLPRIPGEDGILIFSFFHVNYDIEHFLDRIKSDDVVDYLQRLATNGKYAKWKVFSELNNNEVESIKYAGVNQSKFSALLDFEGTVFDINYAAFLSHLIQKKTLLRNSTCYNQTLFTYLDGLLKLDLKPQNTDIFDNILVYGGMRTQLLWLCKTVRNLKVLCSIRSFNTYAVSQIKSRDKNAIIDESSIKIAWEHWYHKVVDLIYLRINYPDKIGLVFFEDLIEKQEDTSRKICEFLGVDFAPSMLQSTIFGNPTKGNSWNSRKYAKQGEIYRPVQKISDDQIPSKYFKIHESLMDLVL